MTTVIDRRTLDQIEFDLIVAERLDDVVACEIEDCPLDAAWSYVHTCGETWIVCTPHRMLVEKRIADLRRRNGEAKCMTCDQAMPLPVPWLPL